MILMAWRKAYPKSLGELNDVMKKLQNLFNLIEPEQIDGLQKPVKGKLFESL